MSPLARPLAFAAAALAAAAVLDLRLADGLLSRPFDLDYVPGGAAMRVAALGHRSFVSDLYWLQTVQYIGDPKADQRGWEKLYPLVDLVTDLDPRHGYAYQTAGIVLSSVHRLDESDRILDKGMAKGPRRWTFPYYRSFNAWFYRGDYAEGARWARIAAETPGASPNISHLAVSLASKSGTPEDAIQMLEQLRATVTDEAIASRLDEQMKLAVLEREAQRIERAIAEFQRRQGRDPFGLEELVVTGLLAVIPKDPFGGTWRWDPDARKVRSTANPFRFEFREDPHEGTRGPPPEIIHPDQTKR
jgi:hypothetical protein